MGMNAKFLADGQLGTTEAALYTCPSGKVSYIKLITFGNNTSSTTVLKVFFRRGSGASRLVYCAELSQNQTVVFTGSLCLEAGDSVRGEAGAANTIDYTIFGVEQIL